jgi:small nuclear ribonucleoprotein (snRNP)-like protein
VVQGDDGRFDGVDAGALVGPVGGDLDARLQRWASEARVDEAARRRAREWWLRRQAEEGATLVGVLADLLEACTAVTVQTRSGRQHRGRVRALGADFVAVGTPLGLVLVALDAVTSLRTHQGERTVVGDRPVDDAASGPLLRDVAAGLAVDRERVLLVTFEGEAVAGVLRSVGQDVAVLRGGGEPPATCYVALDAITELVLEN